MSGKRKGTEPESSNGSNSRDRKKQKVTAARTIAVQPQSGPATAGPSAGPDTTFNSMRGLPGSLDVEKFAEARAFEINAMEDAIENAKGASTHRAWQELPRHLRRRAASHDVRRVPLRLREKARAEMDPVKRSVLKKALPKRGKSKTLTKTEDFLKRQRDKTWLESHLWHAKRMHMEDKWGYRLAITPTEKSYRPSHRAATRGVIVSDVSYFGTIELRGPQATLITILHRVLHPDGHGPGAKRYITGARPLDTTVFADSAYPYQALGPAMLLWKPWKPEDDEPTTLPVQPKKVKGKGHALKGKEKEKEKAVDPTKKRPEPTAKSPRTCWLRLHPAIFDEVFNAVRIATSAVLSNVQLAGGDTAEVHLADLREKLCGFEITGPKSAQVLRGALEPTQTSPSKEFKEFWGAFKTLQSPQSIPTGMVVGFDVIDPRLKFPPKMAKVEPPFTSEGSPSMHAPYAGIPTATVAQSGLWDETMRDGLAKPRFKKKDLDARRADQLIPGTPLTVTPQDARIPVILIQRSVVSTAKANSPSSSTTPGIHGWLLLIPTGWSMPFLSSLLFTGARVGGLRELAVQAFEAGIPSFPADAVDTAVYDDEVEVRAEALGERWLRTPPAKKINYEDRGIDDPWRPDWRGLLGLDPSIKNDDDDAQFVAAQRETATISHSAAPDAELKVVPEGEEVISVHALLDEPTGLALRLWLLRGQDMWTTTSVLAARANPSVSLFEQLNDQRRFRGLEPLTSSAQDVWRSALVNVRYEMCGRGRPNEGSMVFWLDEPEVWSWLKLFDKRKVSEGVAETVDEQELSAVLPAEDHLAGFVTSGNFSLSIGSSHGIGSMPLSIYTDIFRQMRKLEGPRTIAPLVKIRDRDGVVCRAARVHIL